jgi:hypothetical protein
MIGRAPRDTYDDGRIPRAHRISRTADLGTTVLQETLNCRRNFQHFAPHLCLGYRHGESLVVLQASRLGAPHPSKSVRQHWAHICKQVICFRIGLTQPA